ncbi:MAG: nucleotidyltransferase domain-containing protein [Candidatus Altiarchaeales archaeon]|nr:MAG: nucleotidyltransferase domain-containing protein [Candidatus Altiarchaeales archaeon]
MELVKVERVDEEILKEIIRRIVSVIDPEKIILFGSYAYGEPKKESDLDLLVIIKESSLPRYKRSVPIYRALAGILIPKDIIVYTEKEVEEWRNVPLAFITTIIRKGKVIYEKQN